MSTSVRAQALIRAELEFSELPQNQSEIAISDAAYLSLVLLKIRLLFATCIANFGKGIFVS